MARSVWGWLGGVANGAVVGVWRGVSVLWVVVVGLGAGCGLFFLSLS